MREVALVALPGTTSQADVPLSSSIRTQHVSKQLRLLLSNKLNIHVIECCALRGHADT
jgi:hypothetical protein